MVNIIFSNNSSIYIKYIWYFSWFKLQKQGKLKFSQNLHKYKEEKLKNIKKLLKRYNFQGEKQTKEYNLWL